MLLRKQPHLGSGQQMRQEGEMLLVENPEGRRMTV